MTKSPEGIARDIMDQACLSEYMASVSNALCKEIAQAIRDAVLAEREAILALTVETIEDHRAIPCPDDEPGCMVLHQEKFKRHRRWDEIRREICARDDVINSA